MQTYWSCYNYQKGHSAQWDWEPYWANSSCFRSISLSLSLTHTFVSLRLLRQSIVHRVRKGVKLNLLHQPIQIFFFWGLILSFMKNMEQIRNFVTEKKKEDKRLLEIKFWLENNVIWKKFHHKVRTCMQEESEFIRVAPVLLYVWYYVATLAHFVKYCNLKQIIYAPPYNSLNGWQSQIQLKWLPTYK